MSAPTATSTVDLFKWIWDECPAKNGDKLLLLAIAIFCDGKGDGWVSRGILEAKTGMTPRNVSRCIDHCVEQGWLEITQDSKTVAGRRLSRHYRINFSQVDKLSDFDASLDKLSEKVDKLSPHNNTIYSLPSSPREKTNAIPFSNKSLNPPPTELREVKSAARRESVLGKGMSDNDWLDHLATLPQYHGVNVRAKFDHLLKWCADKGEVPTRQRLKVWLDKDAKQQRMAPPAPKIVKIVRDDFSELMQELAVG
jgi:hypothetical protein